MVAGSTDETLEDKMLDTLSSAYPDLCLGEEVERKNAKWLRCRLQHGKGVGFNKSERNGECFE
jgi:hypothetical protein